MGTKEIILSCFGDTIEKLFGEIPDVFFAGIEELRFRVGNPVIILQGGSEYTVTNNGELTRNIDTGYKASPIEIATVLDLISGRSMYAFSEELKKGFITISGGHRVGVTGKAVVEGGNVKTIRNFNSLNIRVSHQVIGCADGVMRYITENGRALHTMIISPPACGKTTMLRDIIRQLSDGVSGLINGQAVGVVDERSEIAGCYMGIPQNDVGIRTDVLDGCAKAEGMLMLLRAMSPKAIAVDEIGKREDIYAIEDVINAGVAIVCTVHGGALSDIAKKPVLGELIDKRIFKRFIVLKRPGETEGIYDENFERCENYADVC